jgi:hypothetical protein
MTRLAALVITVTSISVFAAACSDDSGGEIDAAIDAPIDVAIDVPDGPCGVDYQMMGEYIDWDSRPGAFDGVETSTWTVVGDAARTGTTAPNGRIILCLSRTSTVTITVTQSVSPPNGPYVPAIFVADPAVLSAPGGIFSARGLKTANADASYTAIMNGMTFNTAAAHVFVHKRGTPTAVTIGSQASFVSDGDNDTSWVAGSSGTYVLFPNVPVGNGTTTLGGTFTGPTTIPLEAGRLTIVPIS